HHRIEENSHGILINCSDHLLTSFSIFTSDLRIMREHIVKAIEQYIDKHYDRIREHVDRNLEKLKEVVVEKLPDHVLEFIKKHADDGDGHETMMESIFQVMSSMADQLTDDYKEDLRIVTREHLDEVTVDSTDHLTGVVVDESKKAVREVTSKDDDGESWWKNIDLSFLKGGKDGIIAKILELIRHPIHHASGDINKSISQRVPDKAKSKLYEKFGLKVEKKVEYEVQEEVHDRGISKKHHFTKVLGTIMGGEEGGSGGGGGGMRKSFIDKIFEKIPEKIETVLIPHFQEFEEKLMEHLKIEMHENIFKDDNFLHGMKGLIGKFGDKDGDGKNDFIEGVSNAMESFFHKKKK
ncbi:16151_t:CDS:1, partial [Acaulospora morrowiae]